MSLLKLFPVVVVLVVARNSAGSIDDTFFKTCFCRCPGDCGCGHLLYMLSLCPIFALDRQRTLKLQISDIPRLMASLYSNSKIKYAEEYSEVFQRDDARMILEKRKGGRKGVLFFFLSLSLSRTPNNTNTNKVSWKEILICACGPLSIYILKKVCKKYAEGMQCKSLTLPYS